MEKAKKQVETPNLSDLIQNLETYIPEDEIAKRKLALGISEEFIINILKNDLANQQEMIEDLEVKNRQLEETNAKQTKYIEREAKTLEVANKQFTFLEEASYEITKITDTEFRNTLTKDVPKLIRMGMFTNEHLLILKNLPRMISDLEKGATQPRVYLDKFLEESKKRDSFLSSEKEYRIAAKSHFANNIATLSQQVVSKFINAIKNLLITEKAFTVSRVNAHFLAKFSELQMHLKDEVKKLEKSPHHKPYCTYLLRYIKELESIQGAGCIDTQEDKITFTQDIKPATEEMLENFLKTYVLKEQVITKSLN